MAQEQAAPEQQSDKKQGDKLEHVLDTVAGQGTGLTQDTSHKGSEVTRQEEPLK